VAKQWELSVDEQADIDVLDITNQGCFYRISSIFRHPVGDLEQYLSQTTHVWTHSPFCSVFSDVLPRFDKIVYIIRDPRDTALSHARFMLTPYMKKYYPNDFESEDEYLEQRLESKLRRWVEHVAPYLAHAEDFDIHIVFYERFLHDFADELKRLLNYLGLSLDAEARRSVQEAVTFQSMKQKDPEHVRKGKSGKWMTQMSDEQKRRSLAVTRPLLTALNYPVDEDTGDVRPSSPEDFSFSDMREAIDHAHHPQLSDKLKKRARQLVHSVLS